MNNEIMFEVVPPPKRSTPQYTEKIMSKLCESINKMPSISTLNIPEILDENYRGQPYFRNMDNREFGKILQERCHKEVIINKVVVHCASTQAFMEWLTDTKKKFGTNKFVFVGGTFPLKYPGPSVLEANAMGVAKGLTVGNIAIPSRNNEAGRMLQKTKSGCQFFTTQILLESTTTAQLLKEYGSLCKEQKIKPAKLYLSFTPLSEVNDIEFLKWLGAYIDHETEKRLCTSSSMPQESIKIVEEMATTLISTAQNTGVPVGINIEQVSHHNLEYAERMVKLFS